MVLVSAQDGVHHRRFPLGGGKDETGYVACRHSLQRYGGSERPSILAGAVDVDVDDARKDRFGRVDLIVLRYDDATAKRRLVGFVPAVGHATRTDAAPVVSGLQLVPVERLHMRFLIAQALAIGLDENDRHTRDLGEVARARRRRGLGRVEPFIVVAAE
ncbi:hypothetical protein D3C86_1623070 [compost metagenome]